MRHAATVRDVGAPKEEPKSLVRLAATATSRTGAIDGDSSGSRRTSVPDARYSVRRSHHARTEEPIRDSARFYRRWAFESAALDLALRQNGLSLQDAVGRVAKPVTFVVSTRIELEMQTGIHPAQCPHGGEARGVTDVLALSLVAIPG
jgi:hypothetical protein